MCKNGIKITNYHENPTNRHMSIVFFTKNGTVDISKERGYQNEKRNCIAGRVSGNTTGRDGDCCRGNCEVSGKRGS